MPMRESFLEWSNLKIVLSSLFGAVAGVGIIWYTGQFYALFFLTKTLKVDPPIAFILIGIALTLAIPCYQLAGKLSDRFGRKRIMMIAFVLAIFTYIPIFKALTHYANPALEQAITQSPVSIFADQCAVPLFSAPLTQCEKLRDFFNASGIPHTLQIVPDKKLAVQIGAIHIEGGDLKQMKTALKTAGYPEKADNNAINRPMVVLLLFVLVFYVCLAYGPIATYLVELFPTRIRYSSISMPYHIGTGYFGGFMLYFSTLISTSTGDIYSGLYYPIAIAAMSLIIGTYCRKPKIRKSISSGLGTKFSLAFRHTFKYEKELSSRRYLVKPSTESLRIHVHGVKIDSRIWCDHLKFRERLCSDAKASSK